MPPHATCFTYGTRQACTHSVSDTGVRTASPHLSALSQHEGVHAATRNLLDVAREGHAHTV